MSRKRTDHRTKVRPWLTPKPDCLARTYFFMDCEMLEHPAVKALSPGALKTYLLLCSNCGGREEFHSCPYSAAEKCGIANRSFHKYLIELEEGGFIRVASGKSSLQTNTITFVYDWKGRTPPVKLNKARGKPFKNRSAKLADEEPQD